MKTISCAKCNAKMKHYDNVKRIVRKGYGAKEFIYVERLICPRCSHVTRILPDYLYPHKHYERKIIDGFIFGKLNSGILQYEDYPCDRTIERWVKCFSTDFVFTKK